MTQLKLLAFDLETSKITPDGDDLQAHRPLGICCWAVAWTSARFDDAQVGLGYGIDEDGNKQPMMSVAECRELVGYLARLVSEGYTLLTHNGVSFDLNILAEESGMHAECAELALHSVDICLLVHCLKGYPVGLDAIARAMGIPGKLEGMSGSQAPVLWQQGEYDKVLAYVAQDAKMTLEVALEIERRGSLSWIAKSGRRNQMAVPRLLTVFEAMQTPEPNTEWMASPIPRSRFTSWMNAHLATVGQE